MKALKIFTNGRVEVVELPKREHNVYAMQEALECDLVEFVQCKYLSDDYCLICDEEALLKGKPVINPIASYLYGLQDHGQPICGDVMIMKNNYTPDGIETVGIDDADSTYLQTLIDEHFLESILVTQAFIASLKRGMN